MERLWTILFTLVISIASYGQVGVLDSEEKHKLLNEIIGDNFLDQDIKLHKIPCNDQIKISHVLIQQNFEIINKQLDEPELIALLTMIDPKRCYSILNGLSNDIQLCDSTKIALRGLVRQIGVPQNNFKWKKSKLIKTEGGYGSIICFSEPLVNNARSILLIHVVYSSTDGQSGQTLLFKKINGKWIQVSMLEKWVT